MIFGTVRLVSPEAMSAGVMEKEEFTRMSLIEKVNEHAAEFIGWRRQFHANPELGFKEFATTQFIKEKLESWGIETKPNGDKTGMIATLRGGKPGRQNVADH